MNIIIIYTHLLVYVYINVKINLAGLVLNPMYSVIRHYRSWLAKGEWSIKVLANEYKLMWMRENERKIK